jgi:chromosome segregation protein
VLEEAERRVAEQLAEARTIAADTQGELSGLADAAGLEHEVTALRDDLGRCRAAYGEARAKHDGLAAEARMRAERLAGIARERTQWRDRAAKASSQVDVLEARTAETLAKLGEMADLPVEFEARRGKLMTLMSEAEARRSAANDALQAAETRLKGLEAEWRNCEAALSEAREQHARLGARLEAARERCQEAERRINETLACEPQDVIAAAGLDTPSCRPVPTSSPSLPSFAISATGWGRSTSEPRRRLRRWRKNWTA